MGKIVLIYAFLLVVLISFSFYVFSPPLTFFLPRRKGIRTDFHCKNSVHYKTFPSPLNWVDFQVATS